MSQMTPAQARIVDPLVTELALGYLNEAYVSEFLFPRVAVATRAGYLPEFNRENQRRVESHHAPGATIPEVQISWGKRPFAIVDRALNGKVPVELMEEAAQAGGPPGLDLQAESLQHVQDLISLDVEATASDLARNAANYDANHKVTLAGTTRWSQATSTPIADVTAAKNAIRVSVGVNPNRLLLSLPAFTALQSHASIVDRLKYTSSDAVTEQLLARLFGVDEVKVASGLYVADDGTPTDMWGADAILAYVPKNGNFRKPAYGYNLGLRGYPHANKAFYDIKTNSWLVPWIDTREPALMMAGAGFLFVNAGT